MAGKSRKRTHLCPQPSILWLLVLTASLSAWAQDNSDARPNPGEDTVQLTPEQQTWANKRKEYYQQSQSLQTNGRGADAVKLIESVLAKDRDVFGQAHTQIFDTLVALADAYWSNRQYDAYADCYRQMMEIKSKLYGADDWRTRRERYRFQRMKFLVSDPNRLPDAESKATALLTKSYDEFNAGRLQASLTLASQALEGFKAVYGQNVTIEHAKALQHIGVTLFEQRKLEEAARRLKEAEDAFVSWYGRNCPEYADVLRVRGNLAGTRGNVAEREAFYRQALAVYEKHGFDRPKHALLLMRLAAHYRFAGQLARAETHLRKGLELEEQVNGVDSDSYLSGQNTLCGILIGREKYGEAEDLLTKINAKLVARGSGGDSLRRFVLVNLGVLSFQRGDYEAAIAKYRESLAIESRLVGGRSQFAGETHNRVGFALRALTRRDEAIAEFESALGILREATGERSASTIQVVTNLRQIWLDDVEKLNRLGRLEESRKLVNKAIALGIKYRGDDHFTVKQERELLEFIDILEDLDSDSRDALVSAQQLTSEGISKANGGEFEVAAEMLQRARKLSEPVLGEDHPRIMHLRKNVAICFWRRGEHEDAVRHFTAVMPLLDALYDDQPSVDYAGVLKAMGESLANSGDHRQAISYLRRARTAYERVYAATNDNVLHVIDLLGNSHEQLAEYKQAELTFAELADLWQQRDGKDTPNVALAKDRIGAMLARQGRFAAAKMQHAEALLILATLNVQPTRQLSIAGNTAYAAYKNGEPQLAVKGLTPMLAQARKTKQSDFLNSALYTFIDAHLALGNLEEALTAAEELLQLRVDHWPDDQGGLLQAHSVLEEVQLTIIGDAKAKGKLDAAIEVRAAMIDSRRKRFGEKHWLTRNLEEWQELDKGVLKLSSSKREAWDNHLAQWSQAGHLANQGRTEEAIAIAEEAAAIGRDCLGDSVKHGDQLAWIARLHGELNRYDQAENLLRQVLAINARIYGSDSTYAAEVRGQLGRNLIDQQRHEEAAAELDDALATYGEVEYAGIKATSYATYGKLLSLSGLAKLRSGELAAAKRILDQAEKSLAPNTRSAPEELDDLWGYQAELAMALGDYQREEQLATRRVDFTSARFGNTAYRHAAAIAMRGRACLHLGKFDEAKVHLQAALDLLQKGPGNGGDGATRCLLHLAQAMMRTGDAAVARPLLESATQTMLDRHGEQSVEYANAANLLANLHLESGRLVEAERSLQKLLDASNADVELDSMTRLRIQQKRFGEAEKYARQALTAGEAKLDDIETQQIDRQRAITLSSLRFLLNRFMSATALSGADPEEAYRHLLKWKGQVYAREQAMRRLRGEAGSERLLNRWGNVTSAIGSLMLREPYQEEREAWNRQLFLLQAEKEELEQQLRGVTPDALALSMATPEQIRDALPDKTALIDFYAYDHTAPTDSGNAARSPALAVFVLRPNKPIVRRQISDRDQLTDLVDEWRKAVQWISEDEAQKALEESNAGKLSEIEAKANETRRRIGSAIRDHLWKPLESHLEGAETILYSPDGALGKFPLGAIPGETADSYMVERVAFAVVAVPSRLPQLLASDSKPQTAQPPTLLLVGDVAYGGEEENGATRSSGIANNTRAWLPYRFPYLAGVLPEMQDIEKFFQERFPAGQPLMLTRHDASEEQFRRHAPKHRWVHLATHGFYARDILEQVSRFASHAGAAPKPTTNDGYSHVPSPSIHEGLRAGLALAGAHNLNDIGEDDGILSALEVSTLDLSGVEMAVASACETGLGDSVSGESVVGLQRAFQVSGTRTTVTTLWPVNDLGTRLFMARFYRNLWKRDTPMSKLQALVEAQRWFIDGARKATPGFNDYRNLDVNSNVLPSEYLQPSYWSPFVLSGDWR